MPKIKKSKYKASPNAEFCVLCGTETKYRKDDHIDKRTGYIRGAGQLCRNCYKGLYPRGVADYD